MHLITSIAGRVHNVRQGIIGREDGFQTAEAIGISAVGLLVLCAIWGALSVLGVDLIDWIRSTFGIGSGSPLLPPTG